jgi:hypothetical protein
MKAMAKHVGRPSLVSLTCLLVFAPGCARTVDCGPLGDQCGAGDTGESGDSETGGGPIGDPNIEVNKDVDILFVIDNSGSMGEEQAILAANIGSFIDVLEHDDVEADYRIGITTTDMGNPWCPSGSTTPELGHLVLSSCKTRLADFLFNNGAVDVQDLACNDICTLDESELEIQPSTTDVDPDPKPHPWLERIAGKKNIPSTTLTSAAFACFGPQGVNGCGFESPLEAMYFAVVRAQTDTENNYGFIRDSATLAVIFLTDEADCSYNPGWAEIFDADGPRTFWSDPQANFPTSAVCWNAGVQCSGDPSGYDACDPVNKDVNGTLDVGDDQAVLYPVSRYINLLEQVEQQKQALDANQELIVSLIAGVDNAGQPHYANASDPEFQNNFGIGPGCEAPNPLDPNEPIQAVPPVRLRDVTNAFTPDNMFSICEQDYSPALEAVAARIRTQIQPACFKYCVADSDPATEIVDGACSVAEVPGGPVAECLRDANGYVLNNETNDYTMPSDDVDVCYALRTDKAGLTPSNLDDLAEYCIEQNYNLEFVIERRYGFPAASGVSIAAECELAASPEVTCPGIGG